MYDSFMLYCWRIACVVGLVSVCQTVKADWDIVIQGTGSATCQFICTPGFSQANTVTAGNTAHYNNDVSGCSLVVSQWNNGGYWAKSIPVGTHNWTTYFTLGGGEQSPPASYTWSVTFTNNSAGGWDYSYNGPTGATNSFYVGAGQKATITITSSNKYNIDFNKTSYDSLGNAIGTDFATIPSTDSGWVDGQTTSKGYTDWAKPTVDSYTSSGAPTNYNITYSGATNGVNGQGPWALESTVEAGFSSLRATESQGMEAIANRIGVSINLLNTLASHANDMVNVHGDLVSIKTVLDALNGDVSAIHTLCTTMSGSLSTGNTYLNAINNGTASVVSNTTALGGKLDTLHSDMGTINSALGSILTDVGLSLTELGVMSAYMASVTPGVTAIASNTAGISGLGGKMDTLNGTQTTWHGEWSAHKTALESYTAGAASTLQTMDGRVATIKQGQDSELTYLGHIDNNTADIKDRLNTVTNQLLGIKSGVDVITNGVSSLNEKMTGATNYLDGIAQNTRRMTNQLNTLTNLDRAFDTNANAASWANHSNAIFGQLSTITQQVNSAVQEGLGSLTNVQYSGDESANDDWIITIPMSLPGMSDIHIDCNPTHHPMVKVIMDWVNTALAWLMYIFLLWACYKVLERKCEEIMKVPKGPSVLEILQSGGIALVVTIACLVAIPAAILLYWNNHKGELNEFMSMNPLTTYGTVGYDGHSHNILSMIFWLFTLCIPWELAILFAGIYVNFRLFGFGVFLIFGGMLRTAGGAVLFLSLATACTYGQQMVNVKVNNNTGAYIHFALYGPTPETDYADYYVPEGKQSMNFSMWTNMSIMRMTITNGPPPYSSQSVDFGTAWFYPSITNYLWDVHYRQSSGLALEIQSEQQDNDITVQVEAVVSGFALGSVIMGTAWMIRIARGSGGKGEL